MSELFPTTVRKSAALSICGKYRYRLGREWDAAKGQLMWVMLNPSTADDQVDDPTIRRCMGFARAWGYGGIVVCNLFAYRATNPEDLIGVNMPIGAGNLNSETIAEEVAKCSRVMAAWGAIKYPWAKLRGATVMGQLLRADAEVMCLGQTQDGSPRHPLYVKADTPPVSYKRQVV